MAQAHLDRAVGTDKGVFRLDVAVCEEVTMHPRETRRQIQKHRHHRLLGEEGPSSAHGFDGHGQAAHLHRLARYTHEVSWGNLTRYPYVYVGFQHSKAAGIYTVVDLSRTSLFRMRLAKR
jgi:hypothetical protein